MSNQVLEPTIEAPTQEAAPTLSISLEGVVYLLLGAVVLMMHVLQLGLVPLTVEEVPRALAAWQAVQPQIEITVLADSTLLQLAHMLSFTIFGISEAAARVPTALIGFLLVFSPLLFRDMLGSARTLILTVVLACSPVLLAASRLDSPVVWQVFFGVLALWGLYRYLLSSTTTFAVASTVFMVTAALLTGTTGHVTVLVLVLALLLAGRIYTADEDMPTIGEVMQGWTWGAGFGLSALVVVIISTGFMLYPAGFNALAQSIGSGLTGWVRPVEDAPFVFALLSSLFYEGFFWLFALIGVYLAWQQDEMPATDALFIAWLIVAALAAVFYQGTTAAHALWLTIPLAGLVSGTVLRALQHEDGTLWYTEGDNVNNVFGVTIPPWARWVLAATSALLFSLVLMQLGWLGRSLLTANFSVGFVDLFNSLAPPIFFVLVMLMLLIFAGFSFASLWGGAETIRGGAIGLLFVGLFAALGTGWQVSVSRADDPRELWHTRAIGEEAYVLRETLLELSERESEGFPALPLTVVVDGDDIRENEIIAWTLRDFQNATFVRDVSEARGAEVVLAPLTTEAPDLGGNYVGQSLVITRDWDVSSLSAPGALAWWFQRDTRVPPQPAQEIVLWLRQDVYDGVETPALQ